MYCNYKQTAYGVQQLKLNSSTISKFTIDNSKDYNEKYWKNKLCLHSNFKRKLKQNTKA